MATETQGAPATATAQTKAAEVAVRTVKMDDSRTVEFPGKRRLQKAVTIDEAKGTVSLRLDFENGETRTFPLPTKLMLKAAGHGFSQKMGDEISGVKDLEDAILAIDELADRIAKGEWNESSQGGEGLAGASILMKALIEVSGKTKDEIKAFLGTLNPKQKTAMREQAKIKPVVQRLEAERAAKAKKPAGPAIDTDALLSQLASGKPAPATSAFTQPGTAAAQQTVQGAGAGAKPGVVVGATAAKTAAAPKK